MPSASPARTSATDNAGRPAAGGFGVPGWLAGGAGSGTPEEVADSSTG